MTIESFSDSRPCTLITGGAGFIGSHLADVLLRRGDNILVVDDCNDSYDPALKRRNLEGIVGHKNFRFVVGDISDARRTMDLFRANPIRIVYHLAARAGVRSSIQEPELYGRVNVLGSMNVLNAARDADVKKVILASSSSVYGDREGPFSEEDVVDRPISPYAATKRSMELLAHTFHHLYRIPVACMRLFTVYGPRQRPDMAIQTFVRAIAADQPVPMFGTGRTSRDYTFVDDIVDGLVRMGECDFDYEIVNLGSARPIKLRALIEMIAAVLHKKATILQLPGQPGDVTMTCADISKAQRLFDFHPETGIEDGIRRTIEWIKGEDGCP